MSFIDQFGKMRINHEDKEKISVQIKSPSVADLMENLRKSRKSEWLNDDIEFKGLNPEGFYTYIVSGKKFMIDPDKWGKFAEDVLLLQKLYAHALNKEFFCDYGRKRRKLKRDFEIQNSVKTGTANS